MLTDLMARTQISVKILLRQLTVTMANIQPPRSCALTVASALNSSLEFLPIFIFCFACSSSAASSVFPSEPRLPLLSSHGSACLCACSLYLSRHKPSGLLPCVASTGPRSLTDQTVTETPLRARSRCCVTDNSFSELRRVHLKSCSIKIIQLSSEAVIIETLPRS